MKKKIILTLLLITLAITGCGKAATEEKEIPSETLTIEASSEEVITESTTEETAPTEEVVESSVVEIPAELATADDIKKYIIDTFDTMYERENIAMNVMLVSEEDSGTLFGFGFDTNEKYFWLNMFFVGDMWLDGDGYIYSQKKDGSWIKALNPDAEGADESMSQESISESGQEYSETMRETLCLSDIARAEDETYDGHLCYVLEGKDNDGFVTKYFVDQETKEFICSMSEDAMFGKSICTISNLEIPDAVRSATEVSYEEYEKFLGSQFNFTE